MYAIVFLILTTVLAIICYRVKHFSDIDNLINLFIVILVAMVMLLLFYATYQLYVLKPLW